MGIKDSTLANQIRYSSRVDAKEVLEDNGLLEKAYKVISDRVDVESFENFITDCDLLINGFIVMFCVAGGDWEPEGPARFFVVIDRTENETRGNVWIWVPDEYRLDQLPKAVDVWKRDFSPLEGSPTLKKITTIGAEITGEQEGYGAVNIGKVRE